MNYNTEQDDVILLYEVIKNLISSTPPPDLSGEVEICALETEMCQFKCNRTVTRYKTTEIMNIEFDNGAVIILYSVNGCCTLDLLLSRYTYPED